MKYIAIILFSILICNSSSGQNFSKQDSVEIDNLFYYYMGQIPGAMVGVFQDGNLIYNQSYGLANTKSKDKIGSDHVFYFSSLGKIFTSIAILQLVDDNKLKLENNLCEIFPDFPEYGKSIKVENLLTHTSGLPKYDKSNIKTNETLYTYLVSIDSLLFQPGVKWNYSNSDYPLLSLIIEKTSGMSYQNYLEKKIFKKYKMTKNHFINNLQNQKIVNGHKAFSAYSFEVLEPEQDKITGENKIYLTLSDVEILNKLLFHKAPMDNIDLLFRKYNTSSGAALNYGFGWYIVEKKKKEESDETLPIYWIAGKDNGFSNILAHFPKSGCSVLIMTNRDYNLDMFKKILKIEELLDN